MLQTVHFKKVAIDAAMDAGHINEDEIVGPSWKGYAIRPAGDGLRGNST
jgi:hypothetical protein